jgi:hypothetical protein
VFALIVALGASIIKILHKKIGGLLAGGIYSDPHSWQEIFNMEPSFFLFFCVVFIVAYMVLYHIYK